jgi:hypothetical protein
MLKDLFENRLYGQNVVVSGSVFGSILSEIQNIAIVFTAMYLKKVDCLKCCDIHDICTEMIFGLLARYLNL